VETGLKFPDFQAQLQRDLQESRGRLSAGPDIEQPEQLPALSLAYIGDAVFSLHVRASMLSVEANKVQFSYTAARMASAGMQAQALTQWRRRG
jgi:23S rRNA maturation mini-RNase III